MRTSITSLLLSLAVASSAQDDVPGTNELKDSECKLISPLVDELRSVPSAAEFCSSLLSIPTVTVTSTAMSTSTLTSVAEALETNTLTETLTNTEETTVTGTTTLTVDAVTVTTTT
jgi:UDP-N-acetylmuramyl tripeptide synthase